MCGLMGVRRGGMENGTGGLCECVDWFRSAGCRVGCRVGCCCVVG